MIIYTDSLRYAQTVFPYLKNAKPQISSLLAQKSSLTLLAGQLFSTGRIFRFNVSREGFWRIGFLVEYARSSQYDFLVDFSQKTADLPHEMFCLAGSGEGFHGQRGRPWRAESGNIHLSAFFKPDQKIRNFHAGFPIMTAVSVVETLDELKGLHGRATIKWVNDIMIDEAKVAGFICHTQSMEDVVKTVVLGIGLNVEKTPDIECDSFCRKAISLKEVAPGHMQYSFSMVLSLLLRSLERKYQLLVKGQFKPLLDSYRNRSSVIGRRVIIVSDSLHEKKKEIASGIVSGIGDDLEVFFEGKKEGVREGRMIIEPEFP